MTPACDPQTMENMNNPQIQNYENPKMTKLYFGEFPKRKWDLPKTEHFVFCDFQKVGYWNC